MIINEYEFEQAAKAVYIMNPSAVEQYDSWEDLKSFMITVAYQYCYNTNSFSTGGFVLTAYDGTDGERYVRASVMPYVALKYAESKELVNV